MLRKDLEGDEAKANSSVNHILGNALNNPVELSAAPTVVSEIEPGIPGVYSTKIYINLNNTLYSIALTAV